MFAQVCLQNNYIRMTELWKHLIFELACLFAENDDNLKWTFSELLWSAGAHLPCDLLRQSGHFWKKQKKVETSGLLLLLLLSYLLVSLPYSSCHPQLFYCPLKYLFMDEYFLAKNWPALAPQDVSIHHTWQRIVNMNIANLDWPQRKGETGIRCIFSPAGYFSVNWLPKS